MKMLRKLAMPAMALVLAGDLLAQNPPPGGAQPGRGGGGGRGREFGS
jgi:hypothetical protein